MKKWVTRLGRVMMMGLAWAAVWVPGGALVGALIVGELEPEWIGGPLYASVLCGATFSAVAGIAAKRHRLEKLSLSRAAVWGAVSGLLVGALPFVIGDQKAGERPLWVLPVAVMGVLSLLSAVSAIASVLLARNIRNIDSTQATTTSS